MDRDSMLPFYGIVHSLHTVSDRLGLVLTSPADAEPFMLSLLFSLASMLLSVQSKRIFERLLSRLEVLSAVLAGGWLLARVGFLRVESVDSSVSSSR